MFEVCQEPSTAAALSRSREAEVKLAEELGKPEPRPTEMDLHPIIVDATTARLRSSSTSGVQHTDHLPSDLYIQELSEACSHHR